MVQKIWYKQIDVKKLNPSNFEAPNVDKIAA